MRQQALLMLYSFIVGIMLGAVWDLFRTSRVFLGVRYGASAPRFSSLKLPLIGRRERKGRGLKFLLRARDVLVFAQDICYSIIASAVIVILLYQANYGQVRIYAVMCAAVGFLLYYKTVGSAVIFAVQYVILGIRIAFSYALFFIIWPLKQVFRLVKRLCLRLARIVIPCVKGLCVDLYLLVYSKTERRRQLKAAAGCIKEKEREWAATQSLY